MKKTLVIMMVAMMMVGGLAFGATTASTAATTLSGAQASAAAIAIAGSGVGLTGIDVSDSATVQQVATLTIGSNDVDGLTITHNSSGNLTLVDDGSTTISYVIYSEGTGTTALNNLSILSDAALLAGTKTQNVFVKLGGTATYSGTYSEAVTFTVTDNA